MYKDFDEYANKVLQDSDAENDSYENDSLEVAIQSVHANPSLTKAQKRDAVKSLREKVVSAKSPNAGGLWGFRADSENVAADFGITVTRLTNNLNMALPVPIFGPQSAETAYQQVLNLPAGVTVSSCVYGSNAGQPDKLVITYTDGDVSDVVEVTCNMMPYPGFLKACQTNRYQMSKLRFAVSNTANAQTQFQVTMRPFFETNFGDVRYSRIALGGNITPEQFQTGIIDVNRTINITPEQGLIVPVVKNAGASQGFTITGFVTQFVRN